MPWTPIIGKGMNLKQVEELINGMKFAPPFVPTKIVIHNTAAPTLAQWHEKAEEDRKAGRVPGITRIKNLERYFRDDRGWPSAPHAFVADDLLWPFTPFNKPGTHSPSWNGSAIGIEMVADFSREDDDAGPGLKVKTNTAALTGMLCRKLGIDPDLGIKLHKEDPRTTHDCPGKDFEKTEFVARVHEWMGHAGDYALDAIPIERGLVVHASRVGSVNVAADDYLNLREKASASSKAIAKLKSKQPVTILSEEMNGPTKWLRVETDKKTGWVAARFINA